MSIVRHLFLIVFCFSIHSIAQPFEESIEDILVSASMIPISIQRTANAVDIIDEDDLANSATLDISDLLRNISGLAVSQTGPPGSQTQVRVRGSEANHLLVIIDGIEANNPGQNDEFTWGTLSPNDIERIEIIRGPQSTMHGSDALAGVINIITKTPKNLSELSAFLDYGNLQTVNRGISFGSRKGSVSYQIGISNLTSDGENIARQGREKDGYDNTNINIKTDFIINKQLTIAGTGRRTYGSSEYDTDLDFDSIVDDANMLAKFRMTAKGVELKYSPVQTGWAHTFSYRNTEHNNQDYENNVIGISTLSDKEQLRFISSIFFNNSNKRVSLLLEKEDEEYAQRGPINDYGSYGIFDPNQDRTRNAKSVAAEYRGEIADNIFLAFSKRYERSSAFKNSSSYMLEITYDIDDGNKIRALYGTATKNPTFTELYGFYTNFIGNSDLFPEKSKSWELGLDSIFYKGLIETSVSAFNSKLINEIDGNFIDLATYRFTAINRIGNSKRQGVEFKALIKPKNDFYINFSYTYTDSVQPSVESVYEAELRRPRHIGSLRFSWRRFNRLNLGVETQYNGSQLDYAYPKRISMPNYIVTNISANYLLNDKLDIYFRFDNLLNEKYEEVYSYRAQGRSIRLGIRVKI
jgi:vitamin B12 transporter